MTVEKLIYTGNGLARADGLVVLMPYVLPGERVVVESEYEKPGRVHARTLQVLDPASSRVTPPCPYFTRCGGCHYQHASYEAQLEAKRAILEEMLRRQARIEPPAEILIVSGPPFGYRNRVQLHIDGRRLGYYQPHSHNLCRITQCPIASPRLNETIATLNQMARDSRWPQFMHSLEIFTDEESVQLNVMDTLKPVSRRFFDWCAERIPGLVAGAIDYQGRFQVDRRSFFQVNRFLLDSLVESAVAGAAGETAIDLYSGVGVFALTLARSFRHVVAVECGTAAVRDLEFNAERAGVDNVRAELATAEAYLEALQTAPDFLLLDPPRTGLGKTVVRRLLDLRPPAVTIVSCDPSTLARDLSALVGGGFRIASMTLIDLFPQTYHLETVVRLI